MRPAGVLALDLSSRTGWALGHAGEKAIHGVWVLPGGLGERCSCLAAELEAAISLHLPSLVILEAPLPPQAQTAMHTARLQFGLAAVAEMICAEHAVPCEEARADAVRSTVLGRARVDKSVVVAWCREQGYRPAEDNDADALALLRYRHILSRTRVTAGAGSVAA